MFEIEFFRPSLAELTVQVDELRRQCGQGEPGGQRKRVAAFPLGGIVAWGVPLVGFLVLMYAMAPPPAIRGYLLIVLFFFYGIAGFVLFFSSDWAQQRWNPEGD